MNWRRIAAVMASLLFAAPAVAKSGSGFDFAEYEGPGYAEYVISRISTYEEFLDRCSRDTHFCVMVAVYMRHLKTASSASSACVPDGLPAEEIEAKVENLLRSSLKEHPDWSAEPATENVYLAMLFFWPCR